MIFIHNFFDYLTSFQKLCTISFSFLGKMYWGFGSNDIESKNHFKLFDYMLDNVDAKLSKEMLIEMNKILKRE